MSGTNAHDELVMRLPGGPTGENMKLVAVANAEVLRELADSLEQGGIWYDERHMVLCANEAGPVGVVAFALGSLVVEVRRRAAAVARGELVSQRRCGCPAGDRTDGTTEGLCPFCGHARHHVQKCTEADELFPGEEAP